MGDESLEKSSQERPSLDSLCSSCQTINGEVLIKTRPFHHGKNEVHYNGEGELLEERSTPNIPGIYHTLFLENPAVSVESCPACRLFHNVAYSGITLSEPTVLRLCLGKERDKVEVEDVIKVEKEQERAKTTGETPKLDGKGTVYVFADYGTTAAQKFPRRTIGQSGSDESIACIRRWVNECDSKHPVSCRLGLVGDVIEVEPQMPTRVIDVVSFEGHDPPRLLETNRLRGRYIAVSHSWGTAVKPYTIKKNLECLKQSIDVESLPKTFKDSIFIARKPEVQYVWIDPVCIIQDDHEDWEREAKTMGLVYQKAYLVISASESPGDHVGFLTPNPKVKMDVTLPFQSGDVTSECIYLRGMYTGCIEPRRTAISKRGWVLQERTLSRRILHFDGTQAHWECSQYRVSEDGDKEDITSNSNTSYFLGQNIRPLVRPAFGTFGSDISDHAERREALNTLYHFYACKVHEFSECKLTLASDRLPAILGLGNEISSGTGIRFLEGHLLFEELLFIYSLLWYTETSAIEGFGIPDQARAPSWSWAAMEGSCVFPLLGQHIEFERRIFLKIRRVLEVDALNLQSCNALVCFGRAIAGMKGDSFLSRYSSSLFGWGHMRVCGETEEFQPPKFSFSYRLLDPHEDVERRWPRKNNVKGWVCFDGVEIKPDNFFFIPVCAPLPGQERTLPEIMGGCLGLVVVEAYVSGQYELSGTTNVYKRVRFGGLNGTSWFDQRDEVDFLIQ